MYQFIKNWKHSWRFFLCMIFSHLFRVEMSPSHPLFWTLASGEWPPRVGIFFCQFFYGVCVGISAVKSQNIFLTLIDEHYCKPFRNLECFVAYFVPPPTIYNPLMVPTPTDQSPLTNLRIPQRPGLHAPILLSLPLKKGFRIPNGPGSESPLTNTLPPPPTTATT